MSTPLGNRIWNRYVKPGVIQPKSFAGVYHRAQAPTVLGAALIHSIFRRWSVAESDADRSPIVFARSSVISDGDDLVGESASIAEASTLNNPTASAVQTPPAANSEPIVLPVVRPKPPSVQRQIETALPPIPVQPVSMVAPQIAPDLPIVHPNPASIQRKFEPLISETPSLVHQPPASAPPMIFPSSDVPSHSDVTTVENGQAQPPVTANPVSFLPVVRPNPPPIHRSFDAAPQPVLPNPQPTAETPMTIKGEAVSSLPVTYPNQSIVQREMVVSQSIVPTQETLFTSSEALSSEQPNRLSVVYPNPPNIQRQAETSVLLPLAAAQSVPERISVSKIHAPQPLTYAPIMRTALPKTDSLGAAPSMTNGNSILAHTSKTVPIIQTMPAEVMIQRNTSSSASAPSSAATPSSSEPPNSDELVEKVMQKMMRRLAVENERRGRW